MKYIYILIVFSLFSCAEKIKEEKAKQVVTPGIAEQAEAQDAMEALPTEPFENSSFEEKLATIPQMSVPLKESTNFDDFIEAEDYKDVDAKTLRLEKLYLNFNKEDYGFRAIRCYRAELSKEFYTVVVTILKGDNEMESVLINYTLEGEIIDYEVVSYDEIAEGQSQINSKIDKNKVTIDNIFWGRDNEKQVTTKVLKILDNGKIELDESRSTEGVSLMDTIITQLNLDVSKIKTELIVSKVQPNNSKESIIIIPEIASEYDEHHFDMNSHIVLVDNSTQKITHRYFESFKTNGWTSDAIVLDEIKIDTAPYTISENVRAFGVRVHFYGMSRVNPYGNEALSLFVKSNGSLKKVLHNFDVMNSGGEFDGHCHGEFMESKKTLAISDVQTNGYFDIVVGNTITETKIMKMKMGDCESKDEITTETSILKFADNKYKKLKNSK